MRSQDTEQADSRERQLQALVSSLDDIVFEVDERGTYVNIWTADDTLLFRPPTEVIGKRFDEVFGVEASRPFFEFLERTLCSDTAQTLEYPLEIGRSQHWFAARFNPIHAQEKSRTTVSILVRDITERKRAEALLYAQRDLARAIGTFTSVEGGFRSILDTVLGLSGMDSGGIYLFSSDAQSLDLIYHQGFGEEFVQAVGSFSIDSASAQLAMAGTPLYVSFADPMAQHPLYAAEGLRSLAAVPILYLERVIGCINLASHTEAEIPLFARQALETLAVEVGNFVVHLQSQAALRAGEEKFRQAYEALHASEEKYRSLTETSDAIIVLLDADGRVHYVNERAARMNGAHDTPNWRVEDVVGRTLSELPPPLAALYLARVRQVIATDQGMVMESPAGPKVYRVSIQPIHDAQGKAVMALLSATDITALKQTQQELEELNRVLEERVAQRSAEVQDLYDHAPTGYHSLDANGCFLQINQTHLDWLGYTREELIGRSIMEVLTAAGRAAFLAEFAIFKARGSVRDLEYDLVRKDGSTFPVLINATAVYDEQGRVAATRSTVFDNTERKRAEQALRASEETLRFANAELARALRIKDEFLANMSHELRTPLHGILAVSETLLDQIRGPLNERQQKSVRLIDESGRHLLALINDLLDLSKIEAGRLDLHCAALSVDDTCRASLLFVREMAAKKEIQVDYANALPGIWLVADDQRLKQMLVNLLSNAVKFTPNGGHVNLFVTPDPDAALIHFAVQDNGPGISPADQAKLFQPFIQVDAQLTREHEGTGLGLALVKRLAEQHGGTVQLASTGISGEGACFTITLPFAPVPPPTPAA
ncbi:MAG: PAS domain S-box protein [Caldilineaceae bacterium]